MTILYCTIQDIERFPYLLTRIAIASFLRSQKQVWLAWTLLLSVRSSRHVVVSTHESIRSKHMLRLMSKTFGSAMAALCLVSTLAVAQAQRPAQPMPPPDNPAMRQSQPQNQSDSPTMTLVCTRDDGKGHCTAAAGADGKQVAVVGEGLMKGSLMTCIGKGNVVNCKPAS